MYVAQGDHINVINVSNLPVEQQHDIDQPPQSLASPRSQVKALPKKAKRNNLIREYTKKWITHNAAWTAALSGEKEKGTSVNTKIKIKEFLQ